MPIDISKIDFPDVMNIRDATLFLDLGEQRVRTLHRTGELKADDSSGRLMFKKSDLEAWKSQPRQRKAGSGQRNGHKAWVVRVPAEQLSAVQEALAKFNITLEQRYNYAAQKAYQAKRRAAKTANKTGQPVETVATPSTPPTPAEAKGGGVQGLLNRQRKTT